MRQVYDYCVKNGLDFCQPKAKHVVATVVHHVAPKIVVVHKPVVVPVKVITKHVLEYINQMCGAVGDDCETVSTSEEDKYQAY